MALKEGHKNVEMLRKFDHNSTLTKSAEEDCVVPVKPPWALGTYYGYLLFPEILQKKQLSNN